MKRSTKLFLVCSAFFVAAVAAAPAYAQDFSSSSGNAAGAGLGIAALCCYGVFGLVFLALFVLWIVMLIDAIQRQEYEFPNSSGSSKTLWIVLLIIFSWLTSIIYYFMVFKKIKRGSIAPPPAAPPMPPAPPAPPAAPPMPPAPPAPPAPPMGG